MSVTLLTSPPALSFSADLISAKFACTGYLQQVGMASINKLTIPVNVVAGTAISIKYGNTTVTMTAVLNPDDSGSQFLAEGGPLTPTVAIFASYFQANHQLSRDFIVSVSGDDLIFTAKVKGLGYDFKSPLGSGINTAIGLPAIKKPNYTVLFKLFLENKENDGFNQIYEGSLQLLPGTNGIAEVAFGDKINAVLNRDIREAFTEQPSVGVVNCKISCRNYYFEFAESYGENITVRKLNRSDRFVALHGGLSTIAQFNKTLAGLIAPGAIDKDRFLKQGNIQCYTRSNQPQYLYFYNTRAEQLGAQLKVRFYFSDQTEQTSTIHTFDLSQNRKCGFDLTADRIYTGDKTVTKYEVFIASSADAPLSETRTFYLDYTLRKFVRYFLNWSSFGSLDSRATFGKGESEFELFNQSAGRISQQGDDIRQGKSLTFDSKIIRSFKVSTGWMSRSELIANADFFLSNLKYRYKDGLLLPIQIAPGRIPEIKDGENLMAQVFEYRYHFDDHAYTEGDAENPSVGDGSFFFNSSPLAPIANDFIETDPSVPAWVKSISQADILKWNSAFVNVLYAQTAGYATNSGRASISDYASDSDKWDGRQFTDYLDQPVRQTDAVKFASVVADTVNSTAYVSGFTGSGYKINPDGSAEFDSLTVRKDLNINVLNVREITGSGGSLAITNVAKIFAVVDGGAYWRCEINTDDNTIAVQLRANDVIRCQIWDGKKLKYYSAIVTSVGADYFNLSKTTKVGGGIPEAGDTVFQFGNTTDANRQGLIYLTNSDNGAPYLDVLDGITSDSLAGKTKVRLGKLNGIVDPDFGALDGYGFYGQNVFVKGKIMVTGGNAATINNVANAKSEAITTATTQAQADASAKASAAQVVAIQTAANDATAKVNLLQTSSLADAQAKANVAQQAAQVYADAQAAYEREIAKAYADGKVTAEEAARIADVLAKLQVAKDDATAKVNVAYASANGYTDTKSLSTLSAAQSYADNSATSKANVAQANAISQASSDAQNKANAAQANAVSASQSLINSIKIGGVNSFGSAVIIQPYKMQNVAYIKNGGYQGYGVSNGIGSTGIPGGNGEIRLAGIINSNGLWTVSGRWISNGNFTAMVDVCDQGVQSLPVTTAYTEFKFTVNVTNFEVDPSAYTFVDFQGIPYNYFIISDLKVEHGNQATAWSPSPEDVQIAIDLAKTTADAAQANYTALTANLRSLAYSDVVELAKLGTTIIEGGKIKTTLLDADFIRANVINAGYINTLALDATAIKSGTIDSARINATQIISTGGGATVNFVNTSIASSTTQAQADATAKASAAQVAAILAAAVDATTKANAVQSSSSSDATAKANAAQSAAQTYANAQAAYEREIAKAYADGIVDAEEVARIAQAATNLQNAKDDATAKVNTAIATANGYIDTKALATISAAQTYADSSATTKANAAQVNAVSQASTDAQNKANAAQSAAALLSQQLVNGIKIGGRNFILNSNLLVENNAYSLKVYSLAMSATAGETYTFSAKVNLSPGQIGIYLNLYDYSNYPDIASIYPDADGIFRKTFIMPAGARHDLIGLYTLPTGNAQVAKAFWVKLEKGNKATDWTPAPEDVQTAIDLAKSTADAAQANYTALTANLRSLAYLDVVELAKLGSTIIEGGKIKTTLLDADYIRANVINAGYITALDIVARTLAGTSGTIGGWALNSSSIYSVYYGDIASYKQTVLKNDGSIELKANQGGYVYDPATSSWSLLPNYELVTNRIDAQSIALRANPPVVASFTQMSDQNRVALQASAPKGSTAGRFIGNVEIHNLYYASAPNDESYKLKVRLVWDTIRDYDNNQRNILTFIEI